jgi:hypothetical protein
MSFVRRLQPAIQQAAPLSRLTVLSFATPSGTAI